jgi:hypothetical protein
MGYCDLMAERKVYVGSMGPYLIEDTDDLDDADGDFSGQKMVGIVSDTKIVATEFLGIPISSISVTDIDDPSAELNPLSASEVGGLIATYQAVGSADDEFTMYLWDTDAAAENVPYTVDGDGGTWIAVGGKYRNGDVYVSGDINYGGDLGDHTIASHSDTSVTGAELTTVEGRVDQDLKVAAAPTFAGLTKVGGASDYTAIDADGDISFHGTARIDWAKITANGVTLGDGPPTSGDAVVDLQIAHDGKTYEVAEIAANAGQNLIVDFTGVTAFNWVQILGRVAETVGHALTIQLEITPFNDSAWHTYHVMKDQSADQNFENYSFIVPDDSAYIDSGVVKVRFIHEMAGNENDDWFFDCVALYQ